MPEVAEFTIVSGRHRLHGLRVNPMGRAWAGLVIVHGYGEHAARYAAFMRWLAQRGVWSVATDLRGHGLSTGRRGFVARWEEYLDDLKVVLEGASARNECGTKLFVLGHSHGGLVVARAGETELLRAPMVAGCILVAPYLGTQVRTPVSKRVLAHVANRAWPWMRVRTGLKREWLTRDPEMARVDQADPLLTHIATPRWYLTMRAVQERCLLEAGQFTLPLLCLMGEADPIADPGVAARFVERAGSADKSFHPYPAHLHELLREVGREEIYQDILGWLQARTPERAS
jgi:acylglycerol lipase